MFKILFIIFALSLQAQPSWTTGQLLPSSPAAGTVLMTPPVLDPATNEMVQVWNSGTGLAYSIYSESSWSAGAAIDIGSSAGVNTFAAPVYDPASRSLIQIWQEESPNYYLYAAVFNGTAFGTGVSIPLGASTTLFSIPPPPAVYYPSAGQLIQIWRDINALGTLYYSVYVSPDWSTGAEIPLGASAGVDGAAFSPILYSSSDTMVQIWQYNFALYYSSYDGTSWGAGSAIPLGASSGSYGYLSPISYPPNNSLLQVWINNVTDHFLYYSAYNGSTWTAGAAINPGASTKIDLTAYPVFNPSTSQVVQVWRDQIAQVLYASAYNGSSWTTGTEIPTGSSTVVRSLLLPSYDPISGNMVQVWDDQITRQIYFSTFNGSTWSTGEPVPMGGSTNVLKLFELILDPTSNQLLLTWEDSITHLLYSSTYNGTIWSPAAQIPLGSSSGVNTLTSAAGYDPNTKRFIQVWPDLTTNFLYYSTLPEVTPRSFSRPNNRRY